ncbi:unnamed protein product [Amoebophrya sp. A120]|nr:unnamed protein product [Amoebophrya sp. A120]|eukprot:GSA120T00003424001.1
MSVSDAQMKHLMNCADEVSCEVEADFDNGKLALPDTEAAFSDTYQEIMRRLAQKLHDETEAAADAALQKLPADVVKVAVSGFLKSQSEMGDGEPAADALDAFASIVPASVLTMPNATVSRAWKTNAKEARDNWAGSYNEQITRAIRNACRGCVRKCVQVRIEGSGWAEQRVVDDGAPATVVLRNCPRPPRFVSAYTVGGNGTPMDVDILINQENLSLLRASVIENIAKEFERWDYKIDFKLPIRRTGFVTEAEFLRHGCGFDVTWSVS